MHTLHMLLLAPFDVISGPALLVGGIAAATIAMTVAIASETVVLLLMHWAGFWRCVRDALIANLASGIVGIVLSLLFASPLLGLESPWPIVIVSLILSVVIEGAILRWLGPQQPSQRPWVAALVMNLVSYGLLAAAGAALGTF